jgi:hypothetical protein
MRFSFLPVPSFEDATANFESLQLSILQLLKPQKLQLAFGSGALAWPGGSQFSSTLTVAHGLGVTPQAVMALTALPAGAASVLVAYVPPSDATNIYLRGHTTDGSSPLITDTTNLYWLAVG